MIIPKPARINIKKTAKSSVYSTTFGDANFLGIVSGERNIWNETEFAPPKGNSDEVPIKKALASRVSSSSTPSTPSSRSAAALVRGSAWSRRQRVRL